ncbi:hypothetical protein [Otariodibacter oris]|nr:hypothetical protein [Otariodibacter oris]
MKSRSNWYFLVAFIYGVILFFIGDIFLVFITFLGDDSFSIIEYLKHNYLSNLWWAIKGSLSIIGIHILTAILIPADKNKLSKK